MPSRARWPVRAGRSSAPRSTACSRRRSASAGGGAARRGWGGAPPRAPAPRWGLRRRSSARRRGAASVPSAAVELAKKIFGSLKGRRALVLGAGEMSEVTLECLQGEGVRTAVVANRTFERARELAERWGGSAIHWEEFAGALPE